MRTAEKLSLSGIISEARRLTGGCLPCGADELLVRKAYREMYTVLLESQKHRLKQIQKLGHIPNWSKIILVLGQPGIGTTWFLTYVLVRRLMEGKPTIFQLADFDLDAHTEPIHYLIDKNGVRHMDSPSFSEMDNPDIWVLADRKPLRQPRFAEDHNWLVVVTSSPREDNYYYICKEYSPVKYYLPVWDWEEVVAAA